MRQRPLLALAVVAALFAAALAALAPAGAQSGEGSQQTITWSIGLALADGNNDGIFEKGDTPELQVTFAAAITPDASDQAGGGITDAVITTPTALVYAEATSLRISGGQGIEFQLGPNRQIDRLRGEHLNAKTETNPVSGFICTTPDTAAAKSNGSSPATARCALSTGIFISIPQTVPDNTYNIRGRVAFEAAGELLVDYEQDSGLTDATDDAADTRADRTMASEAFTSTADVNARTLTGATELNEGSASFALAIGPVASVANVSFDSANKCIGRGPNKGLDNDADPETSNTAICSKTLRTSGGSYSHFELKILNSAGRGVVSGQVIAVVGTLIRETGSTNATFATCAGDMAVNSASCTPDLTSGQTGSSIFTVKAPSTPGTATLRLQVVPRAGSRDPINIPLIFTGPATSIELSDVPSTVLNRNVDAADAGLDDVAKGTDSIVLAITPKDADGNVVTQDRIYTYELTGPDSRRVLAGKLNNLGTSGIIVDVGPTPSTGDTANTSSVNQVLIDVTAAATKPLMTGEYTLTVKRTARNLSATTTFRVVGPAANLELVKGDECTNGRASLAEVGCTFEITATVTDADGNNVADGTEVALSATNTDGSNAQNLILSGAGSDSTRTNLKTKAGKTVGGTATVVGNGEVLLVATASGGAVSDSQIADTTASASAVGAESNVLACLSKVEVGEYSTYICDATLTADALFSVLRNRGADAIYLRGAGSWVRYATDAAGTPLPGSGDNFTAVRYDTLFIGG